MNTDDFVEQTSEIHNNLYDYSLSQYINAHTPVCIICPIHGQFWQRPYAHVNLRQGCPSCGKKKRKRKTTEEFLRQCKWNYDYTDTVYTSKYTPIEYICPQHGLIRQKPYLHIKHGCPYCNGRGVAKHTVESFIAKSRQVHGSRYDYSKVSFKSINDKIVIICPEHGEFVQKAANHINAGHGCPGCNGGVLITSEEWKKRAIEKHGGFDYSEVLYTSSHKPVIIICPKHGPFQQLAYLHLQTDYACLKCYTSIHRSRLEEEVLQFIRPLYDGEIVMNDRSVLAGREIDIFLPRIRLGIEIHGNYWHTESVVGKRSHYEKANLAEAKKIRLIQVFEHEWNGKRNIVCSRMRNAVGGNSVLYARKTEVVCLSREEKNVFLEENHLQGKDNSSIWLGLRQGDHLVACMTFGRARFGGNYDYELIRFCSLLGTSVVGGASKVFTYFRKDHSGHIVSYADRRWSQGELYYRLGFRLDGITEPGYFYYNVKDKAVCSRYSVSRIRNEREEMLAAGWERIWTAGNMRFVMD